VRPSVALLGLGERRHRAGLIAVVVVAVARGGHLGSVTRFLRLVVVAAVSFVIHPETAQVRSVVRFHGDLDVQVMA